MARVGQSKPVGACSFCSADWEWLGRRDENAERSVGRSRKQVRRIVRWNDLRRLMTFTNGDQYGVGWTDRKAALDDVARFLKVHGADCFGSYRALLVAEQGGKGGRWHVHVVVPMGGWLPYSKIIRKWSAFMEGRGWSSKTGTHRWHVGDEQGRHKKAFSSARVAGQYIAKYLTKDLGGVDYGSHVNRYRNVGTDMPVPNEYMHPTFGEAIESLSGCKLTAIERPDSDGVAILVGYWFENG